jgi:multiple sugar transport system substrate-binding protein
VQNFEKSHPDIKVEVTSIDWGAAWVRLTTAATSGDTPDICQLGSTWVGAISSMGAFTDLTDRIKEVGGASKFVPAAWVTSGICFSQKVTAIPWFVEARALFYRTDVFKRLGLAVKDLETWDSFRRTLEKIKSANLEINGKKISALGVSGKNDWNVVHNISPWIWGAGGDYLSADYKKSALDSPEAAEGLYFYASLVKDGYASLENLELNSAQLGSNFDNGDLALIVDGPYHIRTLTTSPQEGGAANAPAAKYFGVAPFPRGPKGRVTFIGGSNLAIFKNSRHFKEAWELIKYLLNPDVQIEYAKRTGMLPSVKEAFNDPFITGDPHRRIYREAILYGKTYPCIASWGKLEPVLTRRFGLMWDELLVAPAKFSIDNVKKNLALAAKEINGILAEER